MNVAIIGAGISGLTAAKQLQSLGHDVVVFEKARGRGGRLCSKRLPWGDQTVALDIGAQYFTARDSRFVEAAGQWLDAGVIEPWLFNPHVYRQGSLSVSADKEVRYVGVPSMNHLSHYLSEGLVIRRETRITRLEKYSDEWMLFDEKGYCYQHFDWVFVSAPARQTFDLIDGLSELSHDIPLTSLKPCWALGLELKQQTPADVQGIFSDDKVRWATKLSSRPRRQSVPEQWMLHFDAGWSEDQGKSIGDRLPMMGLNWLQAVFNRPLALTHHHVHYWAYASVDPQYQFQDISWTDSPMQLSVLGDWTQAGRVEGAYLSALDAVQSFVAGQAK